MTDQLLTRQQVADLLAVSPRTVFSLTDRGELPAVRLGGAVRYSPSDIDRFVRAHRTGSRKR